ncbi:MAG: energy transducer TonB, partial [Deltaproteobacteria bacterium]|nr:energy transducer TonB [Deltaproteobacteria bacterium]
GGGSRASGRRPGNHVPGSHVPGGHVPGGQRAKLQASGTLGSIDPNAVQDEINVRLPAATTCFNREFSRLQYLGGKIKLLFRIDTSGRVKWLMVERSSVGSRAVEACIVGVMKGARFDPPSGGEAEFGIPLAFGGGDPVTALGAGCKEARRLRRSCKKLLRGTGRAAPAGLLVTVYIDPAGRVSSAGLSAGGVELSSSFSNAFLANLKKLKLGRYSGNHRKLTYAFNCS